jgi:hypothetical protein
MTATKPVTVIVWRKVAPAIPEEERDHAPAEVAERLWRELVRRVEVGGGKEKPPRRRQELGCVRNATEGGVRSGPGQMKV